ncbi:MAG: hypothetical protein AAFQ14_00295 [Cyanobacteria bacterium J06621_12]
MTKSIRAVKQSLESLKSQVGETATELKELHSNYLELLSHSLKQQLIFSCYQICTQLYPQAFVDLSLGGKQDLQQKLRQLSLDLQPQLEQLVEQTELEPKPIELNLMAELIKKLPKPQRKSGDREAELSPSDLELVKAEIASIENIENLDDIELIAIDASSDELELEPESPLEEPPREQVDFENPEHLLLWHKQIERGIKKTLDDTSRKVNHRLQEAKIIPDRLPNKVIEVAMQADGAKGMRSSSKQPKVPHVMHLAIESDKSKKSKSDKNSTQISLLRLRLAEVEFADHLLNAKRGQIRNLLGKVKQLESQYKAIGQELAVLEAQAAWRSSWYED